MRNRSKLILIVLAAAMLLLLAAGTASASRFRVRESRFELIWDSALEGTKTDFSFRDNSRQIVECPLTLAGAFSERTIAKVTGVNIGQITSGSLGTCTIGSATILRETLPWEIRYASFSGRLPSEISGVKLNILRMSVRFENGILLSCLVRTNATEPFVITLNRFALGGPNNVVVEELSRIGFEPSCIGSSPATFAGTGLIRTPLGGVVTLTLI